MSRCCGTAAQQSSVSIHFLVQLLVCSIWKLQTKLAKNNIPRLMSGVFYKPLLCASLVKTVCLDESLRVKVPQRGMSTCKPPRPPQKMNSLHHAFTKMLTIQPMKALNYIQFHCISTVPESLLTRSFFNHKKKTTINQD